MLASTGRPYYADADGDGYGDDDDVVESCSVPDGYALEGGDCDDTSPEVNPEAVEVCNGLDDDCDDAVDEDAVDADTWYADLDGDGYGHPTETLAACDQPDEYVGNDRDCDDSDDAINPDGDEVCNDVDDNCDGRVDEDEALDATTWYDDGDEDGFGDPDDSHVSCEAPSGYIADGSDCVDTDNDIFPGADELCNDEDDDCDGDIDEDAIDAVTWYDDSDADGYGDPASAETGCDAPSGTVTTGGDCDDDEDEVNPDADEVCDEVDNDCDGTADNDDALDAGTWYADTDSDSYGDASSSTTACEQPSGYVADDSDCHDTDSTAFPDSTSTETPGDGIDTDCDGNDFCTDLDCDGRGDLVAAEYYSGTSYAGAITLFYNDGSGGFSDGDSVALDSLGTYVVVAHDLDDDGYQDLVAANYYNGTRLLDSYVYWGSVTGHSTADRTDLPTQGALDVGIGDFDDDGYDDIAFAHHYDDSTYQVDNYVYWGSATGFSSADRDELEGYGTRRLAVADLDGDGVDDLVACHFYDGSSFQIDSVVWYGGSAPFSSSDELPSQGCIDVAVHDWDDDGYDDIAFSNYRNSSSTYRVNSYLYWGSASGFSTSDREDLYTEGATSVVAGDFDGDGSDDVAFASYYTGDWSNSQNVYVYYDAQGGFGSSSALATRGHYDLQASDLDDDGYDELLSAQYYTGSSYGTTSYVYWGASTGLSDGNSTALTGTGSSSLTPADLDRDGVGDVVMSGYYSGSWSTLEWCPVKWCMSPWASRGLRG